MKNQLRYQDFIDELRDGTHYGVFVDDTGSPSGPGYKLLPTNRKTYVGVVIPPSQVPETYSSFASLLAELIKIFRISELHFTDIYGGNGEFKKIGWEERLSIIGSIAKAFGALNFPIFVQSFEPAQLPEWRDKLNLPENLSIFNFNKTDDAALFFLLLRVKMHVRNHQVSELGTAHVFVDEGWKKNGVGLQSLPIFGPEFDRDKVCFASSKSILLLQLADFAAFVLNRMQIIGSKDVIRKKERDLLQVIQPMVHLYQQTSSTQVLMHNVTGATQPWDGAATHPITVGKQEIGNR
jgi:hypothetical protein